MAWTPLHWKLSKIPYLSCVWTNWINRCRKTCRWKAVWLASFYTDGVLIRIRVIAGSTKRFRYYFSFIFVCSYVITDIAPCQLIVGRDGTNGLCYEHSPAEGPPMANLSDFVVDFAWVAQLNVIVCLVTWKAISGQGQGIGSRRCEQLVEWRGNRALVLQPYCRPRQGYRIGQAKHGCSSRRRWHELFLFRSIRQRRYQSLKI